MRATLGLVLGAALAVFPARADWRVTARVGGTISAVAAEGGFVYVGVGARMHIFDVSNPAAPRETGSTDSFGDNVSDIVVGDSRAYVAAGTDGVHIVDLTDVSNPRSIGQWDSPGSAEGLAVNGTLLALADGPFGLQLVDVSDPASPAPISSVFDTNFAFDVSISGPHAFIAGADAGLLVANISVPAAPRQVVILDTPGFTRDVAVDGETLYLADQWGGVRVISIALPASPREIASVMLPGWAFAVETSGAALHVATGSQGLHTLNIADPSQPLAAGTYAIPMRLTWKVAVANGRAFVGVRNEGVHIVDVTQPPALPRVGTIAPLVGAGPLAVRGDFAYLLAGERGLRVFDLSVPGRLRPRGSFDATGERGGCIATVGDRHVYVCGNPQFRAQLDVIDVSNVDQLSMVTSIPASGGGGAIELLHQESLLYMPNEVGLEVFDVSNPAAPVSRGRIEFVPATTGASSIAVNGTTAFVNAGPQGLNAVDVSNPASMHIIANLPASAGGSISEVNYRDGYVYGAAGLPFSEFVVIDVRDPLRMVRVGSTPLASAVTQDVLLEGPHAYVANGAGGVAVIDIRDPSRPTRVAQIRVPGFAKGLALKDDRLLVTAGTGGLLEIRQTTSPASALGALVPHEPQVIRRDGPSQMAVANAAAVSPPVTTARSIVVTSTGDSGAGTLREALTNLAAGDVITFDPTVFPPTQPATIRVATQLPHLKVGGVVIDASNAGVILDGSSLSGDFDSGIEIEPPSRGNTIRGMQIVNFPSSGIFIGGDGGNVIGGDRSRGSGPTGQGNVINRNRKFGVHVGNPNGNIIVGNFVGTDATGRVGLGRQEFGVDLFYQPGGGTELGGDRVGGSEAWEANVIAGNGLAEVKLHNAGGHRVIGNFIGVDVDENRIGDCSRGVLIDASSDNTVADNVIVAEQSSVWIIDPGACCNQIVNNWIGMTRDGRVIPRQIDGNGGINVNESFNLVLGNRFGGIRYAAVLAIAQADTVVETIIAGNTFEGLSLTQPILGNAPVEVIAASRTFIGGSTAPFRNAIHAGKTGIRLSGGVDRTFILGNGIGEDPRALQNVNGIDTESSVHNFIQNNTIANGSGEGLIIGASRNRIRRNSIYGNQGGAISANVSAGIPPPPHIGVVSLYTVSGTACPRCTIEIFSDPHAQSRWYEGSTVADANGSFSLTRSVIPRGPNLTATATDSAGSTSALSEPVARPPTPPRRRAARH